MANVILVTGASSGFGLMISRALARDGHIVYATMRDIAGKNADRATDLAEQAVASGVSLHPLELDVQSEASAESAVAAIIQRHGRLDVVVHNAGHMVVGATEAFTPDQLALLYDINVLGTQRVNRAALPVMRAAGSGLLVWIGSSSVAGGVPPLLAPYFAAKAGMDALAVSYARELAPLGIESAIIVPGAYTRGTNHFAHAGFPADGDRAKAYADAWPHGFSDRLSMALAETVPEGADPTEVAEAVARIVGTRPGKRPFRTVIDPSGDGSAVAYAVIDRVREQFLHRIGFADLMVPSQTTP